MNKGLPGVPSNGFRVRDIAEQPLAAAPAVQHGFQPSYDGAAGRLAYTRGPKWLPHVSVYNPNSPYLVFYRRGLARVAAGTGGPLHVMCGPGDSTTYGSFATGNIVTTSYPGRLRTLLSKEARFMPAREGISWWGIEGTPSRYTTGTGWANQNGQAVNGTAGAAAGAAGTLDFTPSGNVDTFVIYYVQFSGGATLSAVIDSGGASTKSTAGANTIGSHTVTTTVGTHVLHISSTGTGTTYIAGVEAYDSTAGHVTKVTRAGISGATVSTWNSGAGWAGFDVLTATAVAPDVAFIDLGYNDLASLGVETTKAGYKRIAQQYLAASCTPIISVQADPPATWAGSQQWPAYRKALYDLADELNVPLVDRGHRWAPLGAANEATGYGYMVNQVHPGDLGMQDWSTHFAQVLQALA